MAKRKKADQYHERLRDERRHMEGILNMRFNFFILIFLSVIGSITIVRSVNQLGLMLIGGLVIESLFTLLIGRAQRRLEINMKLLYNLGDDDPAAVINKKANDYLSLNPLKHGVQRWIGYYIPMLLTALLLVSIFFVREVFESFVVLPCP